LNVEFRLEAFSDFLLEPDSLDLDVLPGINNKSRVGLGAVASRPSSK
jgi:hypothetical protein